MYKLIGLLIFGLFANFLTAQELDCQITVNTQKLSGTNKARFKTLERSLTELVTDKSWTRDRFEDNEKIKSKLIITIDSEQEPNVFRGNIQIQSLRPVFNSDYETTMLNHKDNDLEFEYLENELLEYNKSDVSSNLVAVIAYYVHMILGLDYDSFSKNGGSRYFSEAEEIVSRRSIANTGGWSATSRDRVNRYRLIEDIRSPQFKALRDCIYRYHRHGLDKMSSNPKEALEAITQSLEGLQEVYEVVPSSAGLRMFFDAKSDEIVGLYKASSAAERQKIYDLLARIDPGHINEYKALITD